MVATLKATAQTDSTKPKKLQDVVVTTALKQEQKQNTTGKVITVISKEMLEKSLGKSLAQILTEQAGITVNGAYNSLGSVQNIYTRGSSTGRTLILMDGVPMNDPSTIGADIDLNMFSLNDVEKIEICKGAQSTLYGSDAIGGVINIITTKKNIEKPFNAKLSLAGGNLGTLKSNVQLFGKLDKKFTYTARFSHVLTNGFSSATDEKGNNHFDNDGFNGNYFNVAVKYDVNQQLSLKTFYTNTNYKADVDAGIFKDEKDYTIHNKQQTQGFGVVYKIKSATITANFQQTQLNRLYVNDSTFISSSYSSYEKDDYNGKTNFAELFANIFIHKNISLLQGFDVRKNSMNNNYTSLGAWPYSSKFNDTSIAQTSVYSSFIFYNNNKKLNIELGGRFNLNTKFGNGFTYTFNPSYQLNEQWRIFGSIASGYKIPTLYQLYASGGIGNKNLQSETAVNYELGLQQIQEKLSHRIVLFARDITNGIDFDYNNFTYFNANKQKVNGLEYEVTYHPIHKLSLTANYTYLSGKETTQNRRNYKDTTYNYLLRRPQSTFNLNIDYQSTSKLNINVSAKYVSKRFDVGGYMANDIELKSYVLLNAAANYQFNQRWKMFVLVQNITNEKFIEVRGYNAIPMVFLGGITFSW